MSLTHFHFSNLERILSCYLQNVLVKANITEGGMESNTVLFLTNFAHHYCTAIDLFAALTFLGFCCSHDRTVGTRAPEPTKAKCDKLKHILVISTAYILHRLITTL